MRLLFEDMLDRKYRWPTAICVLGVAMFWWGSGVRHGTTMDLREAFVASLTAIFAMGPLLVAASAEPRAVWYLPVSRRDRWRATWLLSVAVPATMVTAAKLPALLFSPESNWLDLLSALTLSAGFDFAYAAVASGIILFLAESRTTAQPVRPLVTGLVGIVTLIVVIGGGLFWPIVFRKRLPLQWSDLSPLSATLLAAALVVSVATYFHTPAPSPPGRGIPASARPRRATGESRGNVAAGLTGLPRLLWNEYKFSVGLGAFLVATCGLVLVIAALVMDTRESFRGLLRMQSLLLFDAPVVHQRRPFDLMIWYALFAMTIAGRFPEMLAHLRALPVAAWRLNLILIAWPALILVTVWTGLVALHVLVLRSAIASLQFPLFVALAGASAAMQAAAVRWPGEASWINGLTLIVVTLVYLADGGAHPWMAILGLAAIAASATANHFTLMRASTYKRAAAAFADASARTWS